jgi:hypothetical protein
MYQVIAVKATRKPCILSDKPYSHIDDAKYHADLVAAAHKSMQANNMVMSGISFQVVTGDISDVDIGTVPTEQIVYQIYGC